MSVRQATVSVLDCDAPNCIRLATPTTLRQEKQAGARRAIRVGWNIDAFRAAGDAGWVQEPRANGTWPTYCPDHADIPTHPRPIRPSASEPQTGA